MIWIDKFSYLKCFLQMGFPLILETENLGLYVYKLKIYRIVTEPVVLGIYPIVLKRVLVTQIPTVWKQNVIFSGFFLYAGRRYKYVILECVVKYYLDKYSLKVWYLGSATEYEGSCYPKISI